MQELKIAGLRKIYPGSDGAVAIDRVNLEIEAGEMLVLLGPSGCGKTTLLRCVAGLEDAQEGEISLDGRPVFDASIKLNKPTHARDIGMVFQNYSLFPHMTVQRNVEYPLRARGVKAAERDERVKRALEAVQCSHLAGRLPALLSGGQQQRIALARALAPAPKIMLLDEPLSNLDALLRVELRAHLRAIHRSLGFTGIYVTHDQIEAFNLGTRVAVMNAGVIEQLDSAREVYDHPATEYVAKFLGIRNSIQLQFRDGWETLGGRLEGDPSLLDHHSGPLQLYVRPEAMQLSSVGEAPASKAGECSLSDGNVVDALYSGGTVDYVIELGKQGGQTLFVSAATEKSGFIRGDNVRISFAHRDALIYSSGKIINRRIRHT